MNLNFLNRGHLAQPGSTLAYGQFGFMHRGGYPVPYHYPLHGYGPTGLDACLAKYEPAWGADFDRISKL